MALTRYVLTVKRVATMVDGVDQDYLELDDEAKTATLVMGIVYTDVTSYGPLQNSWVDHPNGPKAGFAKDAQGIVHLKGLVKDGDTTPGTLIYMLPVGYRPAEDQMLLAGCSDGSLKMARIDVLKSGRIEINNGFNNWLSLDNISYMAA